MPDGSDCSVVLQTEAVRVPIQWFVIDATADGHVSGWLLLRRPTPDEDTKAAHVAQRPAALIAVTVAYGSLPSDERVEWDGRTAEVRPAVPSPAWERLGYDVSDEWLLSGLSNCGYDDDEVGPMRARWGRHLNEYGLFDDAGMAGEFMAATDERVEEHAPFFVYGLYTVERQAR